MADDDKPEDEQAEAGAEGADAQPDAAAEPRDEGSQEGGGDSAPESGPEQGAEQGAEQLPVPTAEAEEVATSVEDAALQVAKEDAAEAPDKEAPEDEARRAEAPEAETPQAESGDGEPEAEADQGEEAEAAAPAAKPAVPGAHLEVDIVPEGVDPLGRAEEEEEYADPYAVAEEEGEPAVAEEPQDAGEREEPLSEPIATAAIDLAAGARYRATGKRKTAIARVTLRPGSGTYLVNGRALEEHFPRATLQRNIRQPLETVGYHERMDVVARLHGGGISAQAGALRHGVSRALLEADPNLRGELKRRGFLTRDSRAKERKKAGLKKARKRPQFSKR